MKPVINKKAVKCHDVNRKNNDKPIKVITKKTFEEQHKNCISCHKKTENCSRCHSNKVLEPFDHAKKTGWALNKYHINLSCVKCHSTTQPHKKVDNKCLSCHKP